MKRTFMTTSLVGPASVVAFAGGGSESSIGTGGGFNNFFIPGAIQINDASRPMKPSEHVGKADDGGAAGPDLAAGTRRGVGRIASPSGRGENY
ncbi:MAG: hypothetical protein E4H09_04575, partial [Spirochaetales bacterium]